MCIPSSRIPVVLVQRIPSGPPKLGPRKVDSVFASLLLSIPGLLSLYAELTELRRDLDLEGHIINLDPLH